MRVAARLLVVLLLLTACTTPDPAGDSDPTEAVLESRRLLGDPMVELATQVIELAEMIDAARHRAPRGQEMAKMLEGVEPTLESLDAAVGNATAAADEAPVTEAAAIVRKAAEAGEQAAAGARQELQFLREVAAIDVTLVQAAEAWDRPGSQSEIRRRLLGVADEVASQRKAARALEPLPAACRQLRVNRLDWVRVVRSRTLRLQAQAHSGGGRTFDELRGAYRRLPFGVEARTADRQDRPCWRTESPVAVAEDDVRAAVEDLEAALSG